MLAVMPLLRRLLLPSLLLPIIPVSTKLVNITVDDTIGDPTAASTLTFSPSDKWSQGQGCPGCAVHTGNTSSTVDISKVFDGTWHDTTYHPLIAGDPEHLVSFTFTGSAVYAYNIIANQIPFVTTLTNLTFQINGDLVGTYMHIPQNTTNTFEYGVLVYANTSLPYGQHTFVMSAGGSNDSLILFDSIIYTQDSTDSSPTPVSASNSAGSISPSSAAPLATSTAASGSSKSSPPIGAIVGGVVGGVISLAVALIVFLSLRARRKTTARRPPPAAEKMDPFVFGGAQRQPGQQKSRALIIPDLRSGRSRLMTRGPGSTTTTDANTQTADNFHGHGPQLASMLPAETARTREAAEYTSRIQALEAHVHALEAQQQLSPGATSDISGSHTWLSQGSTWWTRRSKSRYGSEKSGRSANASVANLHSELASLRSEMAALRGELSQVQLDVLGAAPSYVS
ncbi:hypothetical protein V8D89_011321 [Ganoderma adspersum]